MKTVHHQVPIDAPVERVYAAIAQPEQIERWWDKQTVLQTERGMVLEHDPGAVYGKVQLLVVELLPNRRIEWKCISTHPESSPASSWTNTHIIFDLFMRGGRGDLTLLTFRQIDYDAASPFFKSNRSAWLQVLQNLKKVLESEGR